MIPFSAQSSFCALFIIYFNCSYLRKMIDLVDYFFILLQNATFDEFRKLEIYSLTEYPSGSVII